MFCQSVDQGYPPTEIPPAFAEIQTKALQFNVTIKYI